MLRQPASDSRDAAVRWRQLVDLIARAGSAADPGLLAEALAVIRADSARIDEPLRAAAARAIAALPLPLGLLECFVADRLAVSAPILAAAKLDSGQWRVLLAAADAETRRFIDTLHPDIGPIGPDAGSDLQAPGASELSIGELVSRIERRRSARSRSELAEATAQPPGASGGPGLFLWEAGANGEIDWVEGVPRGALIGRSLAKPAEVSGERIGEDVVRAFADRAPFRDRELVIAGEGPASGQWRISGAPAFAPDDGRFCGYRGSARREAGPAAAEAMPERDPHLPLDSDSLRELVHELKTPLNAIIGFSEIIDGQYLGPAGRRYRNRANDIAGEARILLGAIDDLDLAAKAQSAPGRGYSSELGAVVAALADGQRAAAAKRGVELDVATVARPVLAAIELRLLERLADRFLRSVIDRAVNGERLGLTVERRGRSARLAVTRPVALAGASLGGAGDGDYSLSLARGLARIAGADVALEDKVVAIDFPAA